MNRSNQQKVFLGGTKRTIKKLSIFRKLYFINCTFLADWKYFVHHSYKKTLFAKHFEPENSEKFPITYVKFPYVKKPLKITVFHNCHFFKKQIVILWSPLYAETKYINIWYVLSTLNMVGTFQNNSSSV